MVAITALFGFIVASLVVPTTALRPRGYFEVSVQNYETNIQFRGTVRYKDDWYLHNDRPYRECRMAIVVVPKFSPGAGGWGECHPAIKNQMGLVFPRGLNSSIITEAYDGYTDQFYPCAKVDGDPHLDAWATFTCGPIAMEFKDGIPPAADPAPCPPPIGDISNDGALTAFVVINAIFTLIMIAMAIMAFRRERTNDRSSYQRIP